MNLSKSRYCAGLQCPKIFWLKKNKPEVEDTSAMNQAVLDRGNEVGDLAMGFFGDFTEVAYHHDKKVMLAQTKQLLESGVKTICEASFAYNGNFCAVDILRVFDKHLEIVEVKSSTAVSGEDKTMENEKADTEVKQVYLDDMAYQYYVLSNLGWTVNKVSLMQLNKKYVRHGDLNIQELFVMEDCTEKVIAMQNDIEPNIAAMEAVANMSDEPEKDIGLYCQAPYGCTFQNYCWKHIYALPNSIFDISGHSMHQDKKLDHYYRGIITFEDLLASGEKLGDFARLQIETEVYDLPPVIIKENIKEFLSQIRYPLYFLDFETYMPAIPPFDNSRPYQQITFQYSLHFMETRDGELKHKEFLGKEGTDPRHALAEKLCADIPRGVCTLAWNMSFEKGRIKELAELFPDLSEHLMNIHDGILDLIVPFRGHDYYCRGFKGRSSIKVVLPALFPNESELDYHSLEGIQHGGDAMNAFPALADMPPEERERTRTNLLAYCKLDTLAMVKILDFLVKIF